MMMMLRGLRVPRMPRMLMFVCGGRRRRTPVLAAHDAQVAARRRRALGCLPLRVSQPGTQPRHVSRRLFAGQLVLDAVEKADAVSEPLGALKTFSFPLPLPQRLQALAPLFGRESEVSVRHAPRVWALCDRLTEPKFAASDMRIHHFDVLLLLMLLLRRRRRRRRRRK